MTDDAFDRLVLAPDEVLLLRPKSPLTPEDLHILHNNVPDSMRGRIIVIGDGIDVHVVKKL